VVRSDNGRSGDHFWLSLAQLADTGNPLIRGKTSSVLPAEEGGLFSCRGSGTVRFANFLCD
jgi:hypothetical protein